MKFQVAKRHMTARRVKLNWKANRTEIEDTIIASRSVPRKREILSDDSEVSRERVDSVGSRDGISVAQIHDCVGVAEEVGDWSVSGATSGEPANPNNECCKSHGFTLNKAIPCTTVGEVYPIVEVAAPALVEH